VTKNYRKSGRVSSHEVQFSLNKKTNSKTPSMVKPVPGVLVPNGAGEAM